MRKTLSQIIKETFYEINEKYLTFLTATIVCITLIFASVLFLPPFGIIISIGVYACLMVGLSGYSLRALNEKPVNLEELTYHFKNILNLFIAEIIKWFYIIFYGVFLIIPGIFKFLQYSQTHFLLSENKKMTINEALNESKRLTHHQKGKILMLYLILLFMSLTIILFSGSLVIISKIFLQLSTAATLSWFLIMSLVLIIFVVCPFAHISKALVYENLKEEAKLEKTNPKPSTLQEVAQEIVKVFKPNKKENINMEMKKELKEMTNDIKKQAKKTGKDIKKITEKTADKVKEGAKNAVKGTKEVAKKTKKAAVRTKAVIKDTFEK